MLRHWSQLVPNICQPTSEDIKATQQQSVPYQDDTVHKVTSIISFTVNVTRHFILEEVCEKMKVNEQETQNITQA